MIRTIDLNSFTPVRGQVKENGSILCPAEGLELTSFHKKGEPIPGLEWDEMKYLVCDIETLEEHTLTFFIQLYANGNSGMGDIQIRFTILPYTKVKIPIPLEVINGQTLFPERTKGRMRMIVMGKPVPFNEIEGIKLVTAKCHKDQQIILHNFYLTDTMPEDLLDAPVLLDELGQWKKKQWEGKVSSREECNSILQNLLSEAESYDFTYSNPEWNQYGGWKKLSFEQTGWFHSKYDGKRWWLVDPSGNAFISTGLDCVWAGTDSRVDLDPEIFEFIPKEKGKHADSFSNAHGYKHVNYGIVNLIEAFGEEKWKEAWSKIAKMYLYKWNMNTIADWSSLEFIRFAKMPYVIQLDEPFNQEYPSTAKKLFRDFPDVFSEEYEQKAEIFAAALSDYKEDPYMIGYFMRNEPGWSFIAGEVNIAEFMLNNEENFVSKEVFITRMQVKYSTIEAFNQAWNLSLKGFEELNQPIDEAAKLSAVAKEDLKAFTAELIERYIAVPAAACRKVDPNHMNLGVRYPFVQDPVLLSGHQHMDVFSINGYQLNADEQINRCGDIINMPIMIGEFQFGALDKGFPANGIRAVQNQYERGVAYRYYFENASYSKYAVGAHYFTFNDQSATGRFDGEHYQIGFIDICMQEYSEMTEQVAECNELIYSIASGEVEPSTTKAQYAPPIF
jgi:hypothetical protein